MRLSDERLAELAAMPLDFETYGMPSDFADPAILACRELAALRALRPRIEALIPPPFVDAESRCAVCAWPLGPGRLQCFPGNCSMRPLPDRLYAPERAQREYGGRLDMSRFSTFEESKETALLRDILRVIGPEPAGSPRGTEEQEHG